MPGLRDALFGAATAAAVAGGANLALPPSGPAATGEQVAISAYVHAARTASCPTDWRDLAAIRSIESPASIGTEQADGTVPGVAGPELDGSGVGGNTQAMYDADGTTSRAWGPMQFIRSSWELFGRDANGDGIVSIDNIWDSSAAAAAHLCASRTAGASRWEALRDYNGSGPAAARYADTAIARADALPTDPGDVLAPVADAAKKLAAKAQCDIGTTPSGAPKVGDVANCAAQTTFERLLAGWEATGDLIERDGNVQPVAGIYRMVDEQIARYLGGGSPGPATQDLRKAPPELAATASPRADGLNPSFGAQLDLFVAEAPGRIDIVSGLRTAAHQRDLYEAYLDGTGNLAAWSDGVTCNSDHCAGLAADLAYADLTTEAWAHANAWRYGLQFDVPSESWHISLAPNLR